MELSGLIYLGVGMELAVLTYLVLGMITGGAVLYKLITAKPKEDHNKALIFTVNSVMVTVSVVLWILVVPVLMYLKSRK